MAPTVLALAATLLPLLFAGSNAGPLPAPIPQVAPPADRGAGFIGKGPGSTEYWLSGIQRQGAVAYGNDTSYKVFRNVKTDCGAKGDGATDDEAALNACLQMGNRCEFGCDSTTIQPAILYFPPGTYMVSKALKMHYYTQMVGDALQLPVLKATAEFDGMAVLDADPYVYEEPNIGANWFTNQNNFFRQVRNFVIDLTGMPMTKGAGIHWQVAQATSLQNIVFEMNREKSPANAQTGIFMDNGSGGFMTDLVFNGGGKAMFLGNQQFTTRNLTFEGCNTAIYMNWNWLWTFKSVKINNCGVGLDIANSPQNQTVGSALMQDSVIANTAVGVNTSFTENSIPFTGGSLVLDNVDFQGTPIAVQRFDGTKILDGNAVVKNWAQGRSYNGGTGVRAQGPVDAAPARPQSLTAGVDNGVYFERSKPQYQDYPASAFVSMKSKGAKGDGVTDDTAAIQAALDGLQANEILYFDHGAYVVSKTVNVPATKNVKITGEIWSLIMATGPFFGDMNSPQPVFKVGEPGDKGSVEMSELMFETMGPAPGAVMIQWNSAGEPGANGMWDVHVRIGGSAGTQLQHDKCAKNPNETHAPNPECIGAHTMLHLTQQSSVYIENCWYWVADHELDQEAKPAQIDIYNGRGVNIESQGPVWMYGTASEHSVMYNYQMTNASDLYMGGIQTESPYFQSNPAAPAPFTQNPTDPQFDQYSDPLDKKAWGVRIVNSKNIHVYGAGLYSFFENYLQQCVSDQNCQNRMVSIEGAVENLAFYMLNTKSSVGMVSSAGGYQPMGPNAGNQLAFSAGDVLDADNRNEFTGTLALWRPDGAA